MIHTSFTWNISIGDVLLLIGIGIAILSQRRTRQQVEKFTIEATRVSLKIAQTYNRMFSMVEQIVQLHDVQTVIAKASEEYLARLSSTERERYSPEVPNERAGDATDDAGQPE